MASGGWPVETQEIPLVYLPLTYELRQGRRERVTLADLGEFGLIRRLVTGIATRPDVAVAAGDDAAVLEPGAGQQLVATIDALVEGKHFLRSVASGYDIGYKALAVNLSDIAAMGATPSWALVSLLVPPDASVALLDDIYCGLNDLAREFQVAIVGGNIASTEGPLTVDVALLGQLSAGRALLRRGATPGDVVCVTGALGAAASGVLLLRDMHEQGLDSALIDQARQAMLRPRPLTTAGMLLGESGFVTAMLDVSDGLAADLGHLCEASHVGAVLDAPAVPIHPAAHVIASAYGRDPLELALSGGEDYQLLFTVKAEHAPAVKRMLAEVGTITAEIGVITGDAGDLNLRGADGAYGPLVASGWDHLRAATTDPAGV